MGIAAYYRGNAVIRKQFESERRPVEFDVMDRLNSLPKYPEATRPFGETRIAESNGVHWIFCPTTGFGYWYRTLHEAVQNWDVIVTGYDADKREWTAIPSS